MFFPFCCPVSTICKHLFFPLIPKFFGTLQSSEIGHNFTFFNRSNQNIGKVKCTVLQAPRLCIGRTVNRGVDVQLYPFMTTALEGGECSGSRPDRSFSPGERPVTHCTGGWVGTRVGLDRCGKSRPPPGFVHRTVQPVASRYTD
jgi:hypothetical protein